MIRLHVAADLHADAAAPLSEAQARYLFCVMRLGVGDALRLFNGRDGEWGAQVAAVGKRGGVLRATERLRSQAAPPDLDLVAALVKRAPLETMVEKAAELGARRVRLVVTRRTNVDHVRPERLRAIAVEAAEQTGRLDVPEILEPERLDAVLDGWEPGRALMYCDESGDDPSAEWGGARGRAGPALDALRAAPPAAAWAVLVGPEGGFAPEERARLRELPFATAVSLGPRILRADTAAVAALTLWQAALGDWRAG